MSDGTGITTAVLKGVPLHLEPDMTQDHLTALQGDLGALDLQVEHVCPPREVCRGLPSSLPVSPHK